MNSPVIDAISAIIQISVAPVFLLVALSGLLNTLSTRLGRIIDRKRIVDAALAHDLSEQSEQELSIESERLKHRIRLVNRAIRLCVASALAVCLLVVTLFLAEFIAIEVAGLIASLFMLAMVIIIGALVSMLLEVTIATKQAEEGTGLVVLADSDQDRMLGRE